MATPDVKIPQETTAAAAVNVPQQMKTSKTSQNIAGPPKTKPTNQFKKTKSAGSLNNNKGTVFQEYMPLADLQAGLKRGELIKGALRINQRNYEEAYIDNPDDPVDILILGIPDRNRALHSDVVAVRLKHPTHWKHGNKSSDTDTAPGSNENVQKTAEVVAILEMKHTRLAVGQLKVMQDNNKRWALFSPSDSRIPRMMIPAAECPAGFFERPQDFGRTLFIARVTDWAPTAVFAKGSLCRSLGEAGEIEPETEGMLFQYGIDATEFKENVLACLPAIPENSGWQIPPEEFSYRKDLRHECVFTIDPTTARDLDDALHIKPSDEEGLYEVGVHIADVSWFVKPDTELDAAAQKRATSVYLVHKVIPMLPRLLCEELCSLNPGVDRLTMSVIWKIDADGRIVEEWFGRSVIRSCCKLTYDIAQGFIAEPDREWTDDELPPISSGHTSKKIADCVRLLQSIAVKLRAKRFENGALRLDQPKLSFTLNKETGLPSGCSVYEIRDSNRLIEEFMLLANMAVAHRIYKHFPTTAMLRLHPPPKAKVLGETVRLCSTMGYDINGYSSATLQASLQRYRRPNCEDSDALLAVLVQLLSKPMNLALYFCSGAIEDEESYRHYALSVPLYTHFTSPIRRYPDVVVHRLLAASLGYSDPPAWSIEQLARLATHCNDKKTAAKSVSDASAELFFNIFIKNCGPIEEKAIVMGAMDHSFDILIIRYGIIRRVYANKLNLDGWSFDGDEIPATLTLRWKGSGKQQVVKIFERVTAVLSVGNDVSKPLTLIKPPDDS